MQEHAHPVLKASSRINALRNFISISLVATAGSQSAPDIDCPPNDIHIFVADCDTSVSPIEALS